MEVRSSEAGRIVVEHEDGYTFVFQIHDVDGLVMDLDEARWSSSGPPPDAEDLEQQARRFAETEAQAQGWL